MLMSIELYIHLHL